MPQQYVLRDNHSKDNSVVNDVKCGRGEEAVVRFARCNFSCIHCFSYASSWPNRWRYYKKKREYSVQDAADEINKVLTGYRYIWLRITGGEPFFDMERAMELCSILKLIENNGKSFNNDVVIQTNGFILGNIKKCLKIMDTLAEVSLNVLIEVSLKGTSSDEFGLITLLPAKSFDLQLKGVENLRQTIDGKENLAYRLVMGFGPNTVSNDLPTHAFIHPKHRFLLQMRERWDQHFTEIYEGYLEESPSGDLGFSMACLVTQRWGLRPLRNIDRHGMLLRTNELSNSERKLHTRQWESVHPYFTDMKPEEFYALEFP